LDPEDVLRLLDTYKSLLSEDFDTKRRSDMFQQESAGHGYQTLPCIDPLNKGCPATAPNYIGVCGIVNRFLDWNDRTHEYPQFTRIHTDVTTKKPGGIDYDSLYDQNLEGGNGTSGGGSDMFGKSQEPVECKTYSDSIIHMIYNNETLANIFLANNTWTDYEHYLTGGCHVFAANTVQLPEQVTVGGRVPVVKQGIYEIIGASSLQTVILFAPAADIYDRFAEVNQTSKPNLSNWTFDAPYVVVKELQRRYSEVITNWIDNARGDEKPVLQLLSVYNITDAVNELNNFNLETILSGMI